MASGYICLPIKASFAINNFIPLVFSRVISTYRPRTDK